MEEIMIYDLMNKFKNFAYILFENNDIKKDIDSLVVYITNTTLACELGLKGILKIENKNTKKNIQTHNLEKLFQNLKCKSRNSIYDFLIKAENSNVAEINLILSKISQNFVEWRYYYESEDKKGRLKTYYTNALFLKTFLDAIDSIFLSLIDLNNKQSILIKKI